MWCLPVGGDPTSCALTAASSGQTVRRATPFCGSQCSEVCTACPAAAALPERRHGPTHHLPLHAGQERAQFFNTGNRSGKLRRRIWDIGGRTLHRHRSLSTTLLPARTGVCMQPTPRRSSRGLVRRAESSSVRAGSPRRCRYYGKGCLRDLVRSVELAVQPDALFWARQHVHRSLGRCANAMEGKEELCGRCFLWPHSSWFRRALEPGGEQRRNRCKRSAV